MGDLTVEHAHGFRRVVLHIGVVSHHNYGASFYVVEVHDDVEYQIRILGVQISSWLV